MIKKFLPVLIVFFTLSCAEDVSDAVQNNQTQDDIILVENGRLVFRDDESFRTAISGLNKMNNEGLQQWRDKFSFNSMYEKLETLAKAEAGLSKDEMDYQRFPVGYMNILNDKGEVKIGKDILWYNQEAIYKAVTETDLENIKLNPSGTVPASKYSISIMEPAEDASGMRYVKLGHGRNYAGPNQFEFKSCIDNKKKKYVNELTSFVDFHIYDPIQGATPYSVYLYLWLKFEYKSSNGNWYPEYNMPRRLDWGFTADIVSKDVRGNVTATSQYYQDMIWTSDAKHQITLMEDLKLASGADMGWHEITIVGTMTQAVQTDVAPAGFICNQWDNYW
jgi:hypothetical protein